MVECTLSIHRRRAIMVNYIRPLPIERLGYTSWPLRSSKEIPLFVEDVTERTCSHSSLGCLGIRSRIFRLRVYRSLRYL